METSLQDIEGNLERIAADGRREIEAAQDLKALEECKVKYFGRKGELTAQLRNLSKLSPEEKPRVGLKTNEVKSALEQLLDERQGALKRRILEETLAAESLDVTMPGRTLTPGRLHPLTTILREIKRIFAGLGFEVVDGPEVETEYYNFEGLNIPEDHPSREMWDSFYLGDDLLLRSHTSPVQVRVMEKRRPPFKVIVPGKCYRRDAMDATHSWQFHQVEGFMVDRDVTFADLKGILEAFAREMFGAERRAKFIPSYFPFTEPSAEMAVDCFECHGKGCRICKGSGWIEVLGAGMIHPFVLENVKYDTKQYQGFAFGMGVERFAMLKYGIDDIRLFYENDLRFLRQF